MSVSKVIALVARAVALGDQVGYREGETVIADPSESRLFGGVGGDSATEDEDEDEDENETVFPSQHPYLSTSRPPRLHDFSLSPSPPGSPGSSSTHQRPRKRARWTSNLDPNAEPDLGPKSSTSIGGIGISKNEMKAKAKTKTTESKTSSTSSRADVENTDSKLPHTKFEKDLMAELTCEICFMLLYQPITTPCQHVGLFIFLSL